MNRSFGGFVARASAAGRLVVQPRMGMADPGQMRDGLLAVRQARATTVGTITLDSYTRCNEHAAARDVLASGGLLNGYPIVAHDRQTTIRMVAAVRHPAFPVQVRHGSAAPEQIFAAMAGTGLDATEGGPVSYCLPYSRRPLSEAVNSWSACCEAFARTRERGAEPHLETFGGCMMGQLCPPGLLIAISVLEALFFRAHGLRSVSLSYAQQANAEQDREAIIALRRLAGELLDGVDWHVVLYAYMGVYPRTEWGALLLLEEAARLAVRGGAARLIVKTTAEAHRIPTVGENIAALEYAAAAAGLEQRFPGPGGAEDTGIHAEARAIIDGVLELDSDVGRALILAFKAGYLDVPYCLHPDNGGRTRTRIDRDGRLHWAATGALPIGRTLRAQAGRRAEMSSAEFLDALNFVARKFDTAHYSREEENRWRTRLKTKKASILCS